MEVKKKKNQPTNQPGSLHQLYTKTNSRWITNITIKTKALTISRRKCFKKPSPPWAKISEDLQKKSL